MQSPREHGDRLPLAVALRLTGRNDALLQAALHRHPTNATVVVSASGRTYRVEMGADALIDALDPGGFADAAVGARPNGFSHVVDTLRHDGCLGSDAGSLPWLRFPRDTVDVEALEHTSLLVVGEGRMASLLMPLLQGDLGRRFQSVLGATARLSRGPRA